MYPLLRFYVKHGFLLETHVNSATLIDPCKLHKCPGENICTAPLIAFRHLQTQCGLLTVSE